MPPLIRAAGRVTGHSISGRIAAANTQRTPERSARSAIGLVIGVTLVTMFAVALDSYRSMSHAAFDTDPMLAAALDQTLQITTVIFTGLVGFSAVIAAIGMINTLFLSVLQRTRELGLLRALGSTAAQVRSMVLLESAQLTCAALVAGLLLGTFYGWVAAQSMFGAMIGLAAPTVPWAIVAGVAGFGILLALGAAVLPARRATRVSPVAALAAD